MKNLFVLFCCVLVGVRGQSYTIDTLATEGTIRNCDLDVVETITYNFIGTVSNITRTLSNGPDTGYIYSYLYTPQVTAVTPAVVVTTVDSRSTTSNELITWSFTPQVGGTATFTITYTVTAAVRLLSQDSKARDLDYNGASVASANTVLNWEGVAPQEISVSTSYMTVYFGTQSVYGVQYNPSATYTSFVNFTTSSVTSGFGRSYKVYYNPANSNCLYDDGSFYSFTSSEIAALATGILAAYIIASICCCLICIVLPIVLIALCCLGIIGGAAAVANKD